MKPFCILIFGVLTMASAAELDSSKLHAWYRSDQGLHSDGAAISAWDNSATSPNAGARNLSRVFGAPKVWRVQTLNGIKDVVRFDGDSALWQTAGSWGKLEGPKSIIAFARIADGAEGCLADGSTRSGVAPLELHKGSWDQSHLKSGGDWEIHRFTWRNGEALKFEHQIARGKVIGKAEQITAAMGIPSLRGFIIGANVATQHALKCDVAEMMVIPRAIGEAEFNGIVTYLNDKWGTPKDLPDDQQLKVIQATDDPRVFRTVLRKPGDDGVANYRIPGLATTPRGTLIAVFDMRHKNAGDLPGDIDVGMMRSMDNGMTWSRMQAILDFDKNEPGSNGNGVGDPCVLVDAETGSIFVAALWSFGNRAWNGSRAGMTPQETGQLVITRSDDDGLTWSKPVSITPQVKQPTWRLCFNGPGSGIQLKDGSLVMPAQFRDENGLPHSCFIQSSDHGKTWRISPPAIPDHPPTSEAQIAQLEDGSLLLSMRNEARSGQRAWATYDSRTQQWSKPAFAVPDPTCMASVIKHPSGALLFSNPNSSKQRVAMTIRSSTESGSTWSKGRLLDAGSSSYSCMTLLKDGSVGIIYEAGNTLKFARFPLDWVVPQNLVLVPEGRFETSGKFGWWPARHEEKLAVTKAGNIDLAFLGDSITHNWETHGAATWKKFYSQRKAANFGFGGDSTQHVLWRLDHGELNGVTPKVVVLIIGTNNAKHGDFTPAQITEGTRGIIDRLAVLSPQTKVLLLAVFPRGATPADEMRRKCGELNALLPALADGKRVHFLNINEAFLQSDGTLTKDIMPDLLHPNEKGYSLWAEAMEPKLKELLEEK